MLYRPNSPTSLAAIETLLEGWNADADHFRRAAMAVRRGEPVDFLTVRAASETRETIETVLEKIEGMLDQLAAGDRQVTELLQVLVSAQALAESVERSWEMLTVASQAARPAPDVPGYAIAAE
jgi:hypothetical protein